MLVKNPASFHSQPSSKRDDPHKWIEKSTEIGSDGVATCAGWKPCFQQPTQWKVQWSAPKKIWTEQVENDLRDQRLDLKVARIVTFDCQAFSEIQRHPQQSSGSGVVLIQMLARDQRKKEQKCGMALVKWYIMPEKHSEVNSVVYQNALHVSTFNISIFASTWSHLWGRQKHTGKDIELFFIELSRVSISLDWDIIMLGYHIGHMCVFVCVCMSDRHSVVEVVTLKRLNTSAPTAQATVFRSSHYADHVRLSQGALVKGHRFLHPLPPSFLPLSCVPHSCINNRKWLIQSVQGLNMPSLTLDLLQAYF